MHATALCDRTCPGTQRKVRYLRPSRYRAHAAGSRQGARAEKRCKRSLMGRGMGRGQGNLGAGGDRRCGATLDGGRRGQDWVCTQVWDRGLCASSLTSRVSAASTAQSGFGCAPAAHTGSGPPCVSDASSFCREREGFDTPETATSLEEWNARPIVGPAPHDRTEHAGRTRRQGDSATAFRTSSASACAFAVFQLSAHASRTELPRAQGRTKKRPHLYLRLIEA